MVVLVLEPVPNNQVFHLIANTPLINYPVHSVLSIQTPMESTLTLPLLLLHSREATAAKGQTEAYVKKYTEKKETGGDGGGRSSPGEGPWA